MFINCPYCNALVATDPATDIPPERCPRCSEALRTSKADIASGQAPAGTTAPTQMASPAPATMTEPASASPIADDEAQASRAGDATAVVAGDIAAADIGTMDSVVPDREAPVADASVGAMSEEDLVDDIGADDIRTDADIPTIALPADLMAADVVAEAMLGPGAIEVEIARKMPEDQREPASAQDVVVQAETQGADAQPAPASDVATLERSSGPAIEPDVATEPEGGVTTSEPAAERVPPAATPSIERRAKAAPSFVRAAGARVATPPAHGWRAPVAIVTLSLMLALQLLVADRVDLAGNARWRPWIATLCNVLRCTIPPWREAEAFTLVDRDVRPHPTVAGALRVTASFRNDARWRQPWPRLALTLSDVDGREAGTRRFAAAEYLGAAPTQDELESGQTATIAMDVIEPAPRIVAFTFEFH